MIDQRLVEYAVTARQKQVVDAYIAHGTMHAAANALGCTKQAIDMVMRPIRKRAAVAGLSPEHDYTHVVPEPFIVKGVSTYYGKEGKPTGQWVKSQLSHEKFHELLKEQVDLYFKEVPKIAPTPAPDLVYQEDVIPWFQIGDAHLGMLAHEAETGGNFDLKIAVTELMTAFNILFDECTPCERCVINDLGDFTHYENFAGVTEASGHALDYDGRFPKMIDYYIPLMRFIIDRSLSKFKNVDIIINQGNHSRTNDIWMSRLLTHVYEDDPRVTVLKNDNVYIPYRMGNTFVLVHHSDKCKVVNLPKVMATDFAKDWGEATYRYIDTGHVHHSFTSKEHPGVLVESWNNLAMPDKYAHDGGWRSRQSITRVDRSRTYGDIGRRRLGVEEIRDRIRRGLYNTVPGYKPQTQQEVYTV